MILILGGQAFSVKNMIISEDVRRYSMKLRSFSERIGGYEGPFAVHPHALLSLPLLSD